MTAQELTAKRADNLDKIKKLEDRIDQQAKAGHAVNELYKTLNALQEDNRNIEYELTLFGQSSSSSALPQIEKAIAISSGGGGVAIRPADALVSDKNDGTGLNRSVKRGEPGERFEAVDPNRNLKKQP